MKRIMRERNLITPFFIIAFVMLLSGLFILPACDIGSNYKNYSMVDGVFMMSNDKVEKSLAAYCEWDGDVSNREFTVPDEYAGFKVKCLGAKGNPGFSGKPSPFSVQLPYEIDGLKNLGSYSFVPDDCTSANTFDLRFTVNIGKNVSEIMWIRKSALYAYGTYSNGQENILKYYNMDIYYNVDGENKTFYSQGGDMYYRSNGEKVRYC